MHQEVVRGRERYLSLLPREDSFRDGCQKTGYGIADADVATKTDDTSSSYSITRQEWCTSKCWILSGGHRQRKVGQPLLLLTIQCHCLHLRKLRIHPLNGRCFPILSHRSFFAGHSLTSTEPHPHLLNSQEPRTSTKPWPIAMPIAGATLPHIDIPQENHQNEDVKVVEE